MSQQHSSSIRLGFAGTPEFAATILGDLIAHSLTPVVVYSQPDRPAGRGRRLVPSPVKQLALGHGIPLRQPRSFKHERLEADALDVLVVAAYGLLLPRHILSAPRFGCLNVHASLLPRWRGAAPVERAIMAGDEYTGVTIMQMDEGLDTGPVFDRIRVPIGPTTTGPELEAALARAGAEALRHRLRRLGQARPEPQSGEATYASKLTPEDAVVDWHRDAASIAAQVRALTGRMPVACLLGGARVRILAARSEPLPASAEPPGTIVAADRSGILVRCGSGALRLDSVQINRGKGRPMSAAAAVNGFPDVFAVGARCT